MSAASSPSTDRPPLRAENLTAGLVRPGSLWRQVRVVETTASTNADVSALVAAGAGEGLVEVAEYQHAGRGRLGRDWVAPPRSALTFSVALTPAEVPIVRWPWLSLLAGVAVSGVLADVLPAGAGLKWPNDVLVDGRKLAGILAERVGDSVVLGIGLNVTLRAEELPTDAATSLALAGGRAIERGALLVALLRRFEAEYLRWQGAGGDAEACGLRGGYRKCCVTLGLRVRVSLPDGTALHGIAVDVSSSGALVVRDDEGGTRELAAGDVVHVRPA